MGDAQRVVHTGDYIQGQLATHRQDRHGCSCGVRGRCPDAAAARSAAVEAEAAATPECGDGDR